ncbi:MAG: hypothetical protein ACP6IU_14020 [Candidatus Asgardarchaeia archaeon]
MIENLVQLAILHGAILALITVIFAAAYIIKPFRYIKKHITALLTLKNKRLFRLPIAERIITERFEIRRRNIPGSSPILYTPSEAQFSRTPNSIIQHTIVYERNWMK